MYLLIIIKTVLAISGGLFSTDKPLYNNGCERRQTNGNRRDENVRERSLRWESTDARET